MARDEHTHRWVVQNEEEPENAYLACIVCGEVVDPTEVLALREIARAVAEMRGVVCTCFAGSDEQHMQQGCPAAKARALLGEETAQ